MKIRVNYPEAEYGIGHVYRQKDEIDLAESQFDKVIQVRPRFGDAYMSRADVRTERHQFAKALADYQKAIGEPAGLAELSIFYCEEAFSLLESCAFEDERYFAALIRMYDQAVKRVLELPVAERHVYVQRLGNLRSRARPIGWAIEDELNGVWYEAGLDEY